MSPEFSEKLFLQSVGPLVGAVVGTLIIGTFVARITRKAQERRADNELREERMRAENQLRVQLIGQMTEAATNLYMATQQFWRKKGIERAGDDQLNQQRKELDEQYRVSRVQGEVIERQLEAYFLSSDQRALWHATMDLLTVRYFTLIGLATENLLRANAGKEHSGLGIEQLKDQALVLKTYRETLPLCAQSVLNGTMRPMPS